MTLTIGCHRFLYSPLLAMTKVYCFELGNLASSSLSFLSTASPSYIVTRSLPFMYSVSLIFFLPLASFT